MRRFFQFRLRTALLAIAACSVPLSWIGATLRNWQDEQQAIASLGSATIEFLDSNPRHFPFLG